MSPGLMGGHPLGHFIHIPEHPLNERRSTNMGKNANFDPDFDAVYGITSTGVIIPAGAPSLSGLYAPDVVNDPDTDVLVEGPWSALTGHTGQHGYHGAVMHPSEQWGQWAIEDLVRIADAPDVDFVAFAVIEVRDEDWQLPDGDPIGWAVAYLEVRS